MTIPLTSGGFSRGEGLKKKKALLIGISYQKSDAKKSLGELDSPHEDVLTLRKFLIDTYEYSKADITIMLDRPGEIQPNQKNIRQQAAKLVKGAQFGDHFFFYYGGHSVQVPELSGVHTELDGKDEVIVPMDGRIGASVDNINSALTRDTCLVDNELKRLLVTPLPEGATLMAVLDTCHSATLLDLDHVDCSPKLSVFPSILHWGQLLSWRNASQRRAPMVRKREISDSKHHQCARVSYKGKPMPGEWGARTESPLGDPSKVPLVLCITACKDDQFACEDPGRPDSSFTRQLISVLKEDPHPALQDVMKRVSVKVHEILLDTQNIHELHKLGVTQDPQIANNGQLVSLLHAI
ncbi:peptidase C14, caspase domain-containing protein [Mycena rebaudengoi]|nr:peptidase C14, caspase domain-containing protein [Mycena rebaudengoi]